MASRKPLVNDSAVVCTSRIPGRVALIEAAIPSSRCVFPRPTPPWITSGLNPAPEARGHLLGGGERHPVAGPGHEVVEPSRRPARRSGQRGQGGRAGRGRLRPRPRFGPIGRGLGRGLGLGVRAVRRDRLRGDDVADRRRGLVVEAEGEPELPAGHLLAGLDEAPREMAGDPVAEEGVRDADLERVAGHAQADALAEPEPEPGLAQAPRQRIAERDFEPVVSRCHGHGCTPNPGRSATTPVPRRSRHGDMPRRTPRVKPPAARVGTESGRLPVVGPGRRRSQFSSPLAFPP